VTSALTFTVYDATNTTLVGTLVDVLDAEFVDEFNAPGYGRVSVPMETADAGLLTKDRVVRCNYEGATRFAWFIESIDRKRVSQDGQRIYTAEGRGLSAWLDTAVVYPQGGINDFVSAERPFNFAAADGAWKNTVTWTSPLTVLWSADDTARKKLPVRWPDPSARWIWKTNPSTAVQRGTVNYFRKTFTLASSTRIKFWATADNSMDVYLDGTLMMTSSKFTDNAPSFAQMATCTVRLGAGDHTIAARVRNEKPYERFDLRVSESIRKTGLSIKASNDKVEWTKHELTSGTQVKVNKISATGTGLTDGNTYYVRSAETNNFKLATANNDNSIVNIQKDAEVTLTVLGSMRVAAPEHGLTAGTKVTLTEVRPAGNGLAEGDEYFLVDVKKDEFRLSETLGGTAKTVSADTTISIRLVDDQTAGFLMTAWEVNTAGQAQSLIVRTNDSWEVSDEEAKWYPALILKTLAQEAEDRDVYRLDALTWDYTFASPSSGSWTTSVEATMKVGMTLLQVLDEVVDMGIDIWVTPDKKVKAAERRGSDLSATVSLAIASNLLSFTTKVEPQLKTHALIRTKAGWATKSADLIDTHGRRETYLEFGNTKSEDTARVVADRLLKRTGKPMILASSVEAIPITGALPFADFAVGDRITIPDATGASTVKARVLSIGMKLDGNGVTFQPELEVLA
jgi:hypothetical protein